MATLNKVETRLQKKEREDRNSNMAEHQSQVHSTVKNNALNDKQDESLGRPIVSKLKQGIDISSEDEQPNTADKTLNASPPSRTSEHTSTNMIMVEKNTVNTACFMEDTELARGLVADRVEKINSNPSTPKMPKAPKSRKNQCVQKGQPGIQAFTLQHGFNGSQQEKRPDTRSAEEERIQINTSGDVANLLRELNSTVKKMEQQLNRMEGQQQSTTTQVSQIEVIQQQEVVKLDAALQQMQVQDQKIQALIGVVVCQDQQIQALTNQVNSAYALKMNKNLIINGMPETQGEKCFHEVAHLFKHVLKIEQSIQVKYAHRLGKGQARPMSVKLANAADKMLIFQKFDKLKEANQGRDRPIFITDHLPDAWAERKRFIHFMKQQNKKLPKAQQAKIEVQRSQLKIDGKSYEPPVRAPTVSEFLNLAPEQRQIIRDLQVFKGSDEMKGNSQFIGYAVDIVNKAEVINYYYHVRLLVPEATHLMCAYKLPGVDLTESQGIIDDGEHGGGRVLMTLLNKEKHENRAVFVARYYGGQRLGAARFEYIEKAAVSALEALQADIQSRRPITQAEIEELRRNHQKNIPGPPFQWSMEQQEDVFSDNASQSSQEENSQDQSIDSN